MGQPHLKVSMCLGLVFMDKGFPSPSRPRDRIPASFPLGGDYHKLPILEIMWKVDFFFFLHVHANQLKVSI